MGVEKGEEPTFRLSEDMWPETRNGVYSRRHNFNLENELDRPCVINIVKTNRLRYAGHMTILARPQGTRLKEDLNPGGRMG
jgi:hypothetical protein